MSLGRAALPLVCACMAAGGRPAAAQAPATSNGRVQLEVEGCPAGTAAGVRRVLGVEIGDLLLESFDGETPDAERLAIRCAGDLASVEAAGLSGGPPTERVLRLDDFPGDAAPRALALLGVALLAARSAAVRDRILRRQTATVTAAPSAPPPAPPDLRAGAAAVGRTFLARGGAFLFGGRLQATSAVRTWGAIGGDLEFAAGREAVADVGQTTAMLMSGAATLSLRASRARWRATAGVGGRLGLFRESGRSADPARVVSQTFIRRWGGPIASAGLAATLGRWALTLGGEVGWSVSSVDETAAGVTAFAVRGPWLALSAGADLRVR